MQRRIANAVRGVPNSKTPFLNSRRSQTRSAKTACCVAEHLRHSQSGGTTRTRWALAIDHTVGRPPICCDTRADHALIAAAFTAELDAALFMPGGSLRLPTLPVQQASREGRRSRATAESAGRDFGRIERAQPDPDQLPTETDKADVSPDFKVRRSGTRSLASCLRQDSATVKNYRIRRQRDCPRICASAAGRLDLSDELPVRKPTDPRLEKSADCRRPSVAA